MKQLKVKEEMSILDAVDMLSSMAEIDITLSSEAPLAIQEDTLHAKRWLLPSYIEQNQEIVKDAFHAVKRYLEQIYEKDSTQLHDPQIQKGIQAIMVLTAEAAEKIEKFTDLFKEKPNLDNLSDLKEYQELNEYYQSAIAPLFPGTHDVDENWEEQLGIHAERLLDVQKKGLQDLEDIKEDKHYELFFLQKEDRRPFYDYDMIRRLKLLYDFDQIVMESEGEDISLRCRMLQDKDFNGKAIEILKISSHLMHEFYKEALKYKDNILISSLNKAVMALMLCANPRNLLQHTSSEKRATDYFSDFHFYLREALKSPEYKKFTGSKPENASPFSLSLYLLTHKLCSSYFLSLSHQKEMVSFIRRIIQKGEALHSEKGAEKQAKGSWWKELLLDDESIRSALKQRPSGPMRKIIESFLWGEVEKGWDPLSHKNAPSQIFAFSRKGKEVICLRMPGPVRQESIQKAKDVEEFEGYLKSLMIGDKHQKFMLVNLQDRTSWEEHARSSCLEELTTREEYENCLEVLSLPKNTDFYFQRDVYQTLEDSALFLDQLRQQVEGGEQCGFYIPEIFKKNGILEFSSKMIQSIHENFFQGKEKLSQEERQDFIEIFYFFLLLKCIDLAHPDYISLSCKDSIDTGAAASAEFFSFLRLLVSDQPWKDEEKDFLLWILYAPALFLRERAIHKNEFQRAVSAMISFQEGIKSNRNNIIKEYKNLFQEPFWEVVEIKKAD
jgi:hypothetical protein